MNLQEMIERETKSMDNEHIIKFCNNLCEKVYREDREYIYMNTIDGIKNLCKKYKISEKTKIIIWLMSKCDEEYRYFKYDDRTGEIKYIKDSDLIDNIGLDTVFIDALVWTTLDKDGDEFYNQMYKKYNHTDLIKEEQEHDTRTVYTTKQEVQNDM